MKPRTHFAASVASLLLIAGLLIAGPLTPPAGPIASSNKTLSEVSPRTNVQSLAGNTSTLFLISQPGSYYLTANITGVSGKSGIAITTSDVDLDLNGFSLQGVAGSLAGVSVSIPATNISIRHGSIRGFGNNGVDGSLATNSRCEDLRVSNNSGTGLYLGEGSVVRGCVALGNAQSGIAVARDCTITRCLASGNTGYGITSTGGATITACSTATNTITGVITNGSSPNVDGSGVAACASRLNGLSGFDLGDGSNGRALAAHTNTGTGIIGGSGSTVAAAAAASGLSNGMSATNVQSCATFANSGVGVSCSRADACASFQNGSGIDALNAVACAVRSSGSTGLTLFSGGEAMGCASTKSVGIGIFLTGARATNCLSSANGDFGFRLATEASADACLAAGNSTDGFRLLDRCVTRRCLSVFNTDSALRVIEDGNRIEGNHLITTSAGDGLVVDATGINNVIVSNSCNQSGLIAYTISAGNAAAARTNTPVAAPAWSNFQW